MRIIPCPHAPLLSIGRRFVVLLFSMLGPYSNTNAGQGLWWKRSLFWKVFKHSYCVELFLFIRTPYCMFWVDSDDLREDPSARPRRLSEFNMATKKQPIPNASSFFIFSPTNRWTFYTLTQYVTIFIAPQSGHSKLKLQLL